MDRKSTDLKYRGGFTLVEMLVVVLIIGILAGLISAAALRARNRAKVAAISVEIRQLSMALDQYKQQFGEYPPDFAGLDSTDTNLVAVAKERVIRHLARAFPRFVLTGTTDDKWTYLTGPSICPELATMTPAKALRFWLGGMKDIQGRAIGFSKDPATPLDIATPSRFGPFFDFDPGRVQGWVYYAPGIIPGSAQPYVYFRAETSQSHPIEYCTLSGSNYIVKTWSDVAGASILDSAKPYWDEITHCWINDTSFQILCCGLDGKFGKENVYKSGQKQDSIFPTGVTTAFKDNVQGIVPGNFDHVDDQTNFTNGTIGDDMP